MMEDGDEPLPVKTLRAMSAPYLFRHAVLAREQGEEGMIMGRIPDAFIVPRSEKQKEELAKLVLHFQPKKRKEWAPYYDPTKSAFVEVYCVYGLCLNVMDALTREYMWVPI